MTSGWSIFDQGGGQGAALKWGEDALSEIGAPKNVGTEQVIYDWELSEGGGGTNNPLNMSQDPRHPNYSDQGVAADYNSIQDNLKAFKDYMNMPAYAGIRDSLRKNDPQGARAAIIASSWDPKSHYDQGAAFSDAPIPKHASRIKGGGATTTANTDSFLSGISGLGSFFSDLTSADLWERVGLGLAGAILIIVGIVILAGQRAEQVLQEGASVKRQINTLTGGSSPGGPTEEERANRDRRLALAERNVAIGEKKVELKAAKEKRLSLAPPKKPKANP